MHRTRTALCVKLSLLALGTCYLLWYGGVQLENFGAHIPEYRLVPLASKPDLYERALKVDPALAERALVEERVKDGSNAKLSSADQRAIKWLIAKRFPLFPRKISRFTIRSADEVAVSLRRVPWGTARTFVAGKDSRGWFLFIGDGHPDYYSGRHN